MATMKTSWLTERMKNEWDLLLLMRQHLSAGEPPLRFDILEPPFWTIFSGRTAQVIGKEGTLYELGPDFPTMLHEMIKYSIGCSLIYDARTQDPPEYRLTFWPSPRHPHYNPAWDQMAQFREGAGTFTSTSPDMLRGLLDRLAPGPPPDAAADGPADDQ